MNPRFSAALFLLLSLGLACAAAPAMADSYTYTYTGNNFTTITPTSGSTCCVGTAYNDYTTSDSVSITFTLSSPLGDNLSDASVDPLSFSFTDGLNTITAPGNSYGGYFNFSTNSSGDITAWAMYTRVPDEDIYSDYGLTNIGSADRDNGDYTYYFAEFYGFNLSDPGTWTYPSVSSPVPEPPAATLLGTGMLVLGAFYFLKRRTCMI